MPPAVAAGSAVLAMAACVVMGMRAACVTTTAVGLSAAPVKGTGCVGSAPAATVAAVVAPVGPTRRIWYWPVSVFTNRWPAWKKRFIKVAAAGRRSNYHTINKLKLL
jgi:hypothetical protein